MLGGPGFRAVLACIVLCCRWVYGVKVHEEEAGGISRQGDGSSAGVSEVSVVKSGDYPMALWGLEFRRLSCIARQLSGVHVGVKCAYCISPHCMHVNMHPAFLYLD